MVSEREDQLEELLVKFLKPVDDVPFEIFIRAWFGCRVIKFDPYSNNKLFDLLIEIGTNTCRDTVRSNIVSKRPNEVGNKLEDYVKRAGQNLELDIQQPKGAGYPDLKLRHDNLDVYIEVKSYNQNSVDSAFRSFYLSPPKKPRIDSDGFHIIMSFEVDPVRSGLYYAKGFHLVDAYGLDCSMKFEAYSSNSVMYSDKQILYSWSRRSEFDRK